MSKLKSKFKVGLLATAMAAAMSMPAQAEEFVLSSGSQGGSWYPLAGAIKAIAEKMDSDMSITVTPGAGVANIVGVATGRFPVAFANTISTVDALAGRQPFREVAENVCNLGTLYPQWFQIVARDDANVSSIKDFAGRRLTTQQNGHTGEFLTRGLLDAVGLSYDDLESVSHVSYSDSVNQMKDGHADIFTLGTALPAGAVMDVATSRDIEIVPITDEIFDRFKAQNAAFIRRTIPADSYPNLSGPTDAITYGTHMIAACDYSGEVVRTLLAAVADNLQSLSAVNRSIATLTLEEMAADIGVPLHPAAAEFYAERGVE